MVEAIKPPSPTILSDEKSRICTMICCRFYRPTSQECGLMKLADDLDKNRLASDPLLHPKDSPRRRALFLKLLANGAPEEPVSEGCPNDLDRFYPIRITLVLAD